MNPKNLQRAKEIAEQLPALEEARRILSDSRAKVIIEGHPEGTVSMPTVTLPASVNYNLV